MRILHAFKDYYPPVHGGIEQHINQIVTSLEGFEFTVLTSARGRRASIENHGAVQVIRAKEYWRPVSTPITPSWVPSLRRSNAELFHFHMPNPFGELCLLACPSEVPLVASYHADIVGRRALLPFFAPFQQKFLKRARMVVVASAQMLENAAPLARHRDRAVVIPYGVDYSYWAIRPPEADVIQERYRGPRVVFLGRLSYYKGVNILIQAMQSVEATCLIIGEGPKRRELEAQVRSASMSNKVVFLGSISDGQRRAYYHAADVFVLPSTSRAETFGIAMAEAMACGTPAICTDVGTGTSSVNRHNETGLVVTPGDARALAEALQRLVSDPGLRQVMSLAAANRISTHFTAEKMLGAISELYKSIGVR